MEPKFEPKQYTPGEIAQLEKSRTISDAELLKSGAEYMVGPEGQEPVLNPTNEQIARLKELYKHEGNWVERKIVEGIDEDKFRVFNENILQELKGLFLNAVDENVKGFSDEYKQEHFAGLSDSEIKENTKLRILGRIELATIEARKEGLNSIAGLLSVVSPDSWHFSKESDVLQYEAHGIPFKLLEEKIAPFLVEGLPSDAKKRLEGQILMNATSVAGHWALLYASGGGGVENNPRHIITNNSMYEIPNAYGYTYLDINPVNGEPIARSRYEDSNQSGIFDGERMMSIGKEDAGDGVEVFSTCAPSPAFNRDGYRVRMQGGDEAQSIINGYLYPNFAKELTIISISNENFFSESRSLNVSPSQIKESESEVFDQVTILPDMTLKIGEKEVKPLGRFVGEESPSIDSAGFVVVTKAKFEKF
ncbi:MAG: hypothetical protein HZB12_01345 [Candidatus Yonathbacteria bacterium]|nr:hypothetical protein [Candidatus Yonathbacteria bacterium]